MTRSGKAVLAIAAGHSTGADGTPDPAAVTRRLAEVAARQAARIHELEAENIVLRVFNKAGVCPGLLRLPPEDPLQRVDVEGGRCYLPASMVAAFKAGEGL